MNNSNDNNNYVNRRFQKKSIQYGESYILPIEQTKVTASQAKVKKILEETDIKAQEIIDGAENKVQIIIETANKELLIAKNYDYAVINDKVDKAVDEIIEIIDSEHLRVDRFINDYLKSINLE